MAETRENPPRRKPFSSFSLWLFIIILGLLVWQYVYKSQNPIREISQTEMSLRAGQGFFKDALFNEKDIILTGNDGNRYHCYVAYADPKIVEDFIAQGIQVKSKRPSTVLNFIVAVAPMLIFAVLIFFIFRSMQGNGNKAFTFGKSRARLFAGGKTNTTFKDVAGVEEAKEELVEIVEFLKDPRRFQSLGGRIPRGVLLLGSPGTGKTLLAKAVAGEAGVPFYSISGSDFVEMFVGVGASRVRDLFMQAKQTAPAIAFIDEIDAVGRHRGSGLGGGHDEREQTLNQLLVEMDGFEKNDSVIIIAATNRPDVLDPALLRPGRFDRQVVVDLPDVRGREEILRVHSRELPLSDNVLLGMIARSTPGFSGADLANLCNEAALLAARKSKKTIENEDFEEAKDKVMMGKARRSKVISEDDKKATAVHEAGHVICSVFQEKTEPVHKVTIIPRGFSGGATHFLRSEKTTYSRRYLEQLLVELMGGRAAEMVIMDELTTGASNDIERITDIARNMVCKWGMSERLGPMTVVKEDGNIFLGKEMARHEVRSEETSRLVDEEIRSIISQAETQAEKLISTRQNLLNALADRLLVEETMDAEQLYNFIMPLASAPDQEFLQKKYQRILDIKNAEPVPAPVSGTQTVAVAAEVPAEQESSPEEPPADTNA